LMPRKQRGLEVLRMEFRRFLQSFILIPAQIVRTGRRIIYRILGYNEHLQDFFATFERIRRLAVS
ncbi:MAG: IS1380 family transposase, partial [Pseudomonadota bacterium]|nr:IS1380 family transposase [Pseudomonadota bacterium]